MVFTRKTKLQKFCLLLSSYFWLIGANLLVIFHFFYFLREWGMAQKREHCWGHSLTTRMESQRRRLNCLWVETWTGLTFHLFFIKPLRFCLNVLADSLCVLLSSCSFSHLYSYLSLSITMPSSCRTPAMRCIDMWSCESSLTGVMWNIPVFTASVCTDRSPNEVPSTLNSVIFNLVFWAVFRDKYWNRNLLLNSVRLCVSRFCCGFYWTGFILKESLEFLQTIQSANLVLNKHTEWSVKMLLQTKNLA